MKDLMKCRSVLNWRICRPWSVAVSKWHIPCSLSGQIEKNRTEGSFQRTGLAVHKHEEARRKRRLIPELVKCDLYDYLIGKQEYAQLFKGSYLTNYSWGETTLAELTGDYLYAPEQ